MSKVIARILFGTVIVCGVASAHKMPESKINSKFKNYTQSISRSLAGRQVVKSKERTLEYVTESEARRLTNQELEKRRVYVGAKAGIGHNRYHKFKEGPAYIKKAPKVTAMYHLALGRNVVPAARAELDLQWGKMRYKAQSEGVSLSQTIKLSGLTLNGYYDILPDKLISPYATAGGGLGINKANDLMVEDLLGQTRVRGKKTKSFIWNVGAGARVKLGARFNVDLGYRYMYLGKTRTASSDLMTGLGKDLQYVAGTQKIYGNQFLLAANYYFQ